MKKENLENLKKGVVGILSAVGAVTVANGMMNVISEKCGDEKFVNKQKKKLVKKVSKGVKNEIKKL